MKQLKLDAPIRSVQDIGSGDFVKIGSAWKEVGSNDAQGVGRLLPRRWTVRTTDGATYGMLDINRYAKAEDFR